MAEQNWKSLMIANVVMPVATAIAVVLTTLLDGLNILVWMGFVVVLLGLSVVNLVAPAFLWKHHGRRSLIPAATLVLVGLASVYVVDIGTKAMLSRTPLSATFLHGRAQHELESAGFQLLRGEDPQASSATLDKHGFTADVDTAGRVVTFHHYRKRTWTRYYFAPYGLPGPLTSEAQITEQDIPDWGALYKIAKYAASGRTRRAQLGFQPSIAMPIVQSALGESLLVLGGESPAPLAASIKARLVGALNEQCWADSRLIEHRDIGYGGLPRELWVEQMRVQDGWGLSVLLKELIAEGVISVAPDRRHFVLKSELTKSQRNRVTWLHAGILELVFADLLERHEYNYDKRVADHWYVWSM